MAFLFEVIADAAFFLLTFALIARPAPPREEKAQNPPVKPGFVQRVATAIANLFRAIFG